MEEEMDPDPELVGFLRTVSPPTGTGDGAEVWFYLHRGHLCFACSFD
jgi:hypothetical protein